MRKIYTLIVVGILGTTTLFGQGFDLGLDYMMLSGTMIENSDGNPVKHDGEDVSGSSIVLNLNYTYNLSKKLDVIGYLGYGLGFELVPIKASLSYGISSSLSANLGMGLYMITDDSYVPAEITVSDDTWKGSSNEFGLDFGVNYQMDAIGVAVGYNMIKDYDTKTLNAITLGISYAFGSASEKADKPAKKKKTSKPKKKPKTKTK